MTVDTGRLRPLLALPGVTDVLVNGPEQIWVDRGSGLERIRAAFTDDEEVRALAVRLAGSAGRRLDAATPFVDARLGGDVRLHAALAPVAGPGTCLSLRVLRRGAHTVADLCGETASGPAVFALLRALVVARLAIVVSGGTGSGKTTLLRGLLELADQRDRVIVVEDAGELAPDLPHVVSLEARTANVEGRGGIGLRALVREALRMRPDRLVIGEIRGAEIAELLLALNTGHEGGATTIHANGVEELPARLEALGSLAGLSADAVHSQAAAALHVVVHLRRDGPRRHVAGLGVFRRAPDGRLNVIPALIVPAAGPVEAGPGAPILADMLRRSGISEHEALLRQPC